MHLSAARSKAHIPTFNASFLDRRATYVTFATQA
jgi:hypothetical protein